MHKKLMKKKLLYKFISSCAAAAMVLTSVGNPVSTLATTLENDTAVAGMAVSLNNYYANSNSPEADILEYLRPVVAAPAETEPTSAAAVKADVQTEKGQVQGTARADDLVEEGAAGDSGIVSTTNRLFMRKSPSLTAPVVAYLYNSCKVEIFETITNDSGTWYLIRTNGIEGYVSAEYVLTGAEADTAETNVQNKYATILADALELYDTAASAGKVLDYVYKDSVYPVMQYSGDYVMIKVSDTLWGYVRRDSVRIETKFAEAVAIDDEFIKQKLEGYIIETDDAKRIYDERRSVHDYVGAKYAIDYCVEMWNAYIETATYAGMTDLVAAAQKQRDDAQALSDAVAKIIAEIEEEAKNNVTEPPVTPSTAPSTDPTSPSTAPVPSADPTSPSTAPSAPSAEPTSPSTDPTAPSTDPTSPSTAPSAPSTDPASPSTAPSAPSTDPTSPSTAPSTEPAVPSETAPVNKEVVKIEACYSGGQKYAGEVIYSAELYLRVWYSDGTEGTITDPSQWTSPDVGMILAEGERIVTMYYGELRSAFPLTVLPAQQAPSAPAETTPAPTDPAETTPTPTTPAPETTPTPTTPVPETTPAPTEPSQPSSENVVSIVKIEARYNGGQKYEGQVISASELYVHVWYSDGTETNITDPAAWSCAQVGMNLTAGEFVVTMTYNGHQSSFPLNILPVETAPPETTPAPTTPAPTTPAPTTPAPTEPPTTPAPSEPGISAARQQVVNFAQQWVGKCNYVYGGNNLAVGGGVDCSAFTKAVFATVGVSLPRSSGDQRWAGTQISRDQLRAGDLIYYYGHVAVYIGNGMIVHAKNATYGIVYDPIDFSPTQPAIAFISLLP